MHLMGKCIHLMAKVPFSSFPVGKLCVCKVNFKTFVTTCKYCNSWFPIKIYTQTYNS